MQEEEERRDCPKYYLQLLKGYFLNLLDFPHTCVQHLLKKGCKRRRDVISLSTIFNFFSFKRYTVEIEQAILICAASFEEGCNKRGEEGRDWPWWE